MNKVNVALSVVFLALFALFIHVLIISEERRKVANMDYSIKPESFHTEGVMPNGDFWQISNYNGRYYSRVWNISRTKDEIQELDDYAQALEITKAFLSMGWGYKH